MKRTLSLLLVFIAALAVQVRPAAAASAVVCTGTSGSCTEAAFESALGAVQAGGGGVVTFNCGGVATIVFSSEKVIKVDEVIVEGDGQIILSGGYATRLFRVNTGGLLTLRHTVMTDGQAAQSSTLATPCALSTPSSKTTGQRTAHSTAPAH